MPIVNAATATRRLVTDRCDRTGRPPQVAPRAVLLFSVISSRPSSMMLFVRPSKGPPRLTSNATPGWPVVAEWAFNGIPSMSARPLEQPCPTPELLDPGLTTRSRTVAHRHCFPTERTLLEPHNVVAQPLSGACGRSRVSQFVSEVFGATRWRRETENRRPRPRLFLLRLGGPKGRTLFIVATKWNGPEKMFHGERTGQIVAIDVAVPHAGHP